MAKVQTFVTLCCCVFFVLTLAASVVAPNLIVPNLSDLTVKTRHTSGDGSSQLKILYVKGSRQRIESVVEKPVRAVNLTVIRQCDQKQLFVLNERDKIYNSSAIKERSEWLRNSRPSSPIQLSGAEVMVTVDSVDTGERRQFEHYTARRNRLTIRFDPGPGASTPARVERTEGWYIDIPGFGCQDQASLGFSRLSVRSCNPQDRWRVQRLGNAPRGYPIEETSIITEGENTSSSKVELLEISEGVLTASLFDLPAGYRLALQTGNGGADLTKVNSIESRARHSWMRLTLWVRSFSR